MIHFHPLFWVSIITKQLLSLLIQKYVVSRMDSTKCQILRGREGVEIARQLCQYWPQVWGGKKCVKCGTSFDFGFTDQHWQLFKTKRQVAGGRGCKTIKTNNFFYTFLQCFRSIPKHAVIEIDPKKEEKRQRDNCLFEPEVYDKMLTESMMVCDMLQMHLNDCIINTRAKSPNSSRSTPGKRATTTATLPSSLKKAPVASSIPSKLSKKLTYAVWNNEPGWMSTNIVEVSKE